MGKFVDIILVLLLWLQLSAELIILPRVFPSDVTKEKRVFITIWFSIRVIIVSYLLLIISYK